jgi:hypothetical protein
VTVPARTVPSGTRSGGSPETTRSTRADALATPWAGSRVRRAAPMPVAFSDLPATRIDGSGAVGQSLDTPWQGTTITRPDPAPVSFSALPAPVVTRRTAPLTVRSAFVPRPRTS